MEKKTFLNFGHVMKSYCSAESFKALLMTENTEEIMEEMLIFLEEYHENFSDALHSLALFYV